MKKKKNKNHKRRYRVNMMYLERRFRTEVVVANSEREAWDAAKFAWRYGSPFVDGHEIHLLNVKEIKR